MSIDIPSFFANFRGGGFPALHMGFPPRFRPLDNPVLSDNQGVGCEPRKENSQMEATGGEMVVSAVVFGRLILRPASLSATRAFAS
jgi:hypothetical protein